MKRLTLASSAVLAGPAFAAGDAFEGASWWVLAISFVSTFGVVFFLSAGVGFFLQGFMRLQTAVVLIIFLSIAFLALLINSFGLEKTERIMPLFALMLALCGPLFGLGWFIGTRDTKRRRERMPAQHGIDHG
jgi:hypothetical protein